MNVDYRQFLGRTEDHVVPVFERGVAWLEDGRRLPLPGADVGWWHVVLHGRKVQAKVRLDRDDPSIAEALFDASTLRGVIVKVGGIWRLSGHSCCQVQFPPDEEPPLFSPLKAKAWAHMELVWHEILWEDGTEALARRAYEEQRGLDSKGVSSALRGAFVLATTERVSQLLGIPFTPTEILPWWQSIVDRGPPGAQVALANLNRHRAAAEVQARVGDLAAAVRAAAPAPLHDDLEARLELSLRKSGAQFRTVRRLGNARCEVGWAYQGERLITVVDEGTLQVRDAGLCLTSGSERGDERLTLDSLPGVVGEAIAKRKLVITRHDGRGDWDDEYT